MNLGFVSLSVFRYVTAALMASPVGVPLPSGVVAATAAVTACALPDFTATGIALVTEPAMHSEPSPSGNTFKPQDTDALVCDTTSLTPGTTRSHLEVPLVPAGASFMDPERSSTIKISAGLRSRLKSLCAHSPLLTSPEPLPVSM